MTALIRRFALVLAAVMLVVWAVGTLAFEAPGWLHLLLTLGVSLAIYGVVIRGTAGVPDPGDGTKRK